MKKTTLIRYLHCFLMFSILLPVFFGLTTTSGQEKMISGNAETVFFVSDKAKLLDTNTIMDFSSKNYICELGKVILGGTIEKTIFIQNKGKQDLIIKKITTDNNCSVSIEPSGKLSAGKKSRLKIFYHTKKTVGDISSNIIIYSNDLKNQIVIIRARLKVKKGITIQPNNLNFGRINKFKQLTEKYVIIGTNSKRNIKIINVEAKSPFLKVKYIPSVAEKGEAKIAVSFKKLPPQGLFHEEIILYTNDPRQPSLKCYTNAFFTDRIIAEPEHIIFKVSPLNPHPEAIVNVFSGGNKNFNILTYQIKPDLNFKKNKSKHRKKRYLVKRFSSKPNEIHVKINSKPNSGDKQLKLTFKRLLSKGENARGKLVLMTNVSNHRYITIKYFAYSQER